MSYILCTIASIQLLLSELLKRKVVLLLEFILLFISLNREI